MIQLTTTQFLIFHKIIKDEFIDVADTDYLAARILRYPGLTRQYIWMGSQAVEKYAKALALLSRREISRSHDFKKILKPLYGEFSFPSKIQVVDSWGDSKSIDFKQAVSKIQTTGKSGARYSDAVRIDDDYFACLDAVSKELREKFFNSHLGTFSYKLEKPDDATKKLNPFSFEVDGIPKDPVTIMQLLRSQNNSFYENPETVHPIPLFRNLSRARIGGREINQRDSAYALHVYKSLLSKKRS